MKNTIFASLLALSLVACTAPKEIVTFGGTVMVEQAIVVESSQATVVVVINKDSTKVEPSEMPKRIRIPQNSTYEVRYTMPCVLHLE